MSATTTDGVLEDFPAAARTVLHGFYEAKSVANGTSQQKITALREGHDLRNAIITADGDIDDEKELLRVLEFYVLTKQGIL